MIDSNWPLREESCRHTQCCSMACVVKRARARSCVCAGVRVCLFTLMGAVLTEDENNSSGKQCETTTIESPEILPYPRVQCECLGEWKRQMCVCVCECVKERKSLCVFVCACLQICGHDFSNILNLSLMQSRM